MSRQPEPGEVTEEDHVRKRLRLRARLNDPWRTITRQFVETHKMWEEDQDVGWGEGCQDPLRREVFRVQRTCDECTIPFARALRASMEKGLASYGEHKAAMAAMKASRDEYQDERLYGVVPGCNAPPMPASP